MGKIMQKPLHYALVETYNLHRKKSRQEFMKLNLSDGQPKILLQLLTNNGILQKDLASRCGVQPATMTSLLRKMLSEDMITKKEIRISGGKSGYLIFLTEYGRSMAYKVIEIFDELEEVSYKGFTEKEKEQLLKFLERISNNLD